MLVVAVVCEVDWREVVMADVMGVCLVVAPCVIGEPLVAVVVAAVLVLRALFSRVG